MMMTSFKYFVDVILVTFKSDVILVLRHGCVFCLFYAFVYCKNLFFLFFYLFVMKLFFIFHLFCSSRIALCR